MGFLRFNQLFALLLVLSFVNCGNKKEIQQVETRPEEVQPVEVTQAEVTSPHIRINDKLITFSGEKGDCLGHVLNNYDFGTKSTNVISLASGSEYAIYEEIHFLAGIGQTFIIEGNYATIKNNYVPELPENYTDDEYWEITSESFMINMLENPLYKSQQHADKKLVVKRLTLTGAGSGIRVHGNYGTILEEVHTRALRKGFELKFCLMATIKNCMVQYRNQGIYLGIIGNGHNSFQSNVSVIESVRCNALRPSSKKHVKPPTRGLHIESSNLVKVSNFITENWEVEEGILVNSEATTVPNIEFTKCHFENGGYKNAALNIDAKWLANINIDQMYYSGISGPACRFALRNSYNQINFTNMGWMGKWTMELATEHERAPGTNSTCWINIESNSPYLTDTDAWRRMFGRVLPTYFYVNGERVNLTSK